jgi:hypothetical protein
MSQHTQFAPEVNERTNFPLCRLHNLRIVDSLPPGCPYTSEWPHDRLAEMHDASWREISYATFARKERYEICSSCRLPQDVRERLRPRNEKPARSQLAASGPITVCRVRK